MEPGIDVVVIPHLYDLKPDGTGLLALQGIMGNMIVLSWLYERARPLDARSLRHSRPRRADDDQGGDDDEDEEEEEERRRRTSRLKPSSA